MRPIAFLLTFIVISGQGPARADGPYPATVPASPATRPAFDLTTPLSAKWTYDAVRRGNDVDALTAAIHADTPDGRRLLAACLVTFIEQHRLADAVETKFGRAARASVYPWPLNSDELSVTQVGDRATVSVAGSTETLMARKGGSWRVDLEAMAREKTIWRDEPVELVLRFDGRVAEAYKRLTEEVAAGLYPDAEAFRIAMSVALVAAFDTPADDRPASDLSEK